MFGIPDELEGPLLLRVGRSYMLSVLDSWALLPMMTGSVWLCWGLFKNRSGIIETIRLHPTQSAAGIFIAGLGLGLLLATAFMTFFWWWAIGAVLFWAMILVAVAVAKQKSKRHRLQQ